MAGVRGAERLQVVSLSGGRSSAYMLHCLLEESPQKDRVVVFCNTGKERTETLDFVEDVGRHWGVKVVWLEYRYNSLAKGTRTSPRHTYQEVTRETASTQGEPFRQLVRGSGGFLPNYFRRRCTQELKVKTIERYMFRHLGLTRVQYVENVGIRYDEPRRWHRAMAQEDCRLAYPLVIRGITKEDIAAFWAAQPFDLGIPSDMGNCDLCFLKGKRNLMSAMRQEPERVQFWEDMEEETGNQFSDRHSYRDLLRMANYRDLPIFSQDEPATDCYCGE